MDHQSEFSYKRTVSSVCAARPGRRKQSDRNRMPSILRLPAPKRCALLPRITFILGLLNDVYVMRISWLKDPVLFVRRDARELRVGGKTTDYVEGPTACLTYGMSRRPSGGDDTSLGRS